MNERIYGHYDAETFRETMDTLAVRLAGTRKLLAGVLERMDESDMNDAERVWWHNEGKPLSEKWTQEYGHRFAEKQGQFPCTLEPPK